VSRSIQPKSRIVSIAVVAMRVSQLLDSVSVESLSDLLVLSPTAGGAAAEEVPEHPISAVAAMQYTGALT
jgi:hypothetical protein